jgi:hypothetical protein
MSLAAEAIKEIYALSKTTRPHRASGVAAEMRSHAQLVRGTSAVLQPDCWRALSLVAPDLLSLSQYKRLGTSTIFINAVLNLGL